MSAQILSSSRKDMTGFLVNALESVARVEY